MKINHIGINVLDDSDAYFNRTKEVGYTQVEVPITHAKVIINGYLVPARTEQVKKQLARYQQRYSVHAPNRTNLAYRANPDLEYQVLEACIHFCRVIDAKTLVYHSGLQALDDAHTGAHPLPGDDELARGAEKEVEALRRLAPIAADLDVTIAMENGDPHLWEYAVLRANGQPPEALPKYHPRLKIEPIIAQLEAIDHPNVGMTLDLAHLHIAAHTIGFDYLAAVSQAAPWVRHLHLNDNFGRLDTGFDSEYDRLPYGEADLHLPPGWGAIPFVEAFQRLAAYEGDLIIELKRPYIDHLEPALRNIQEFLAEAGATVITKTDPKS
jgi:sugar phosphate isomerase/epimerase